MRLVASLVLIISITFLSNCNSGKIAKKNLPIVYETGNCGQEYKVIDLEKLIGSLSSYNNMFVEISGYYYKSIEESKIGIYPPGPKNNSENMIWVDFSSNNFRMQNNDTIFLHERNEINNISTKKVKIRGIIEGRNYAGCVALIRDVCYLEILK